MGNTEKVRFRENRDQRMMSLANEVMKNKLVNQENI